MGPKFEPNSDLKDFTLLTPKSYFLRNLSPMLIPQVGGGGGHGRKDLPPRTWTLVNYGLEMSWSWLDLGARQPAPPVEVASGNSQRA